MIPAWALKLIAAGATLASVVGAAAQVSRETRNPAAPLQPRVLTINREVQTASGPAVTATYES